MPYGIEQFPGRFDRVCGQSERAREHICAAPGNGGQQRDVIARSGITQHAIDDFIDRAIATKCDDQFATFGTSTRTQLDRMSPVVGFDDFNVVVGGESMHDDLATPGGGGRCVGIDDEQDAHVISVRVEVRVGSVARTSKDDAADSSDEPNDAVDSMGNAGAGLEPQPTGKLVQVRVAIAIAALETLGVVLYAITVAVAAIRTPGTISAWPVEVAIYLIFAGGLFLVLRGLIDGRGFARAPFVVAQMFGLIVGWTLLSGTDLVRVVGVIILLMSATGLAAGLSPALRAHLGR